MPDAPAHSRGRRDPGDLALAGGAILILITTIGWPACHAVYSCATHLKASAVREAIPSISLLASSLAWAGGIALIATALAWPAAWWIRRRGWGVAPILATPLLVPTSLAYTALGLARAPGTFLGDRLERLVGQGWPDAPMLASKLQALLGLAFWSWPIAAFVIAAGLQKIESSTLEQLRLDTASRVRRHLQLLTLARSSVLAGLAAVALVMLGSAVPLHLAEAPTLASKIWMEMTLRPGDAGIWMLGWPTVVTALAVAISLSGSLVQPDPIASEGRSDPTPAGLARLATLLTLVASTLLPLALLAASIRHAKSLSLFWIYSGPAFAQSLTIGAITGLLVALVGVWVWRISSTSERAQRAGPCRAVLLPTLTAGLLPGVLVGKATSEAWSFLPALQDSPAILVLGHTARFAFLGALTGLWLARAEPASLRELRTIDGQIGFGAWFVAVFRARWPMLGAVILSATCLSLHEVESGIFLQPPGLQSLSQTLLGYLHYSKLEELSAACVWVVGLGLIAALIGSGLAAISLRREI